MNATPPPPRRVPIARWLYLGLTVLGLIFPARRYATWLVENGPDAEAFVDALTANLISTGLTGTVFVLTSASLIFIFTECLARRDRLASVCIPITCVLGVGVGLPLYLYLRLRRRD